MAGKKKAESHFFCIFNTEEQPVAMAYAQTSGGALSKFEVVSGLSRDGFRAEQVSFGDYNCCLLTHVE